jgi:hypothetical protein
MKRLQTISSIVAVLVFTTACSDVPTETEPTLLSPQFGKVKDCTPPNPHPSCQNANVLIDVAFPAGAIAAGYRIYGDVADGSGTYVDGACGIDAEVLYNSQDAWMDPDAEWEARLGCDRRSVRFDYSCEVGQTCTPGTNVEASGARMTIGGLGLVTSSETDVWAFFVPDGGGCCHNLRPG